jgi:hypothetical protein
MLDTLGNDVVAAVCEALAKNFLLLSTGAPDAVCWSFSKHVSVWFSRTGNTVDRGSVNSKIWRFLQNFPLVACSNTLLLCWTLETPCLHPNRDVGWICSVRRMLTLQSFVKIPVRKILLFSDLSDQSKSIQGVSRSKDSVVLMNVRFYLHQEFKKGKLVRNVSLCITDQYWYMKLIQGLVVDITFLNVEEVYVTVSGKISWTLDFGVMKIIVILYFCLHIL